MTIKYSVDQDNGDLFEDGATVGKLITGNSGACYRLVDAANNIEEITRQRDQLADELAALMESSKGAIVELRAQRDQLLNALISTEAELEMWDTWRRHTSPTYSESVGAAATSDVLAKARQAITQAERGAK